MDPVPSGKCCWYPERVAWASNRGAFHNYRGRLTSLIGIDWDDFLITNGSRSQSWSARALRRFRGSEMELQGDSAGAQLDLNQWGTPLGNGNYLYPSAYSHNLRSTYGGLEMPVLFVIVTTDQINAHNLNIAQGQVFIGSANENVENVREYLIGLVDQYVSEQVPNFYEVYNLNWSGFGDATEAEDYVLGFSEIRPDDQSQDSYPEMPTMSGGSPPPPVTISDLYLQVRSNEQLVALETEENTEITILETDSLPFGEDRYFRLDSLGVLADQDVLDYDILVNTVPTAYTGSDSHVISEAMIAFSQLVAGQTTTLNQIAADHPGYTIVGHVHDLGDRLESQVRFWRTVGAGTSIDAVRIRYITDSTDAESYISLDQRIFRVFRTVDPAVLVPSEPIPSAEPDSLFAAPSANQVDSNVMATTDAYVPPPSHFVSWSFEELRKSNLHYHRGEPQHGMIVFVRDTDWNPPAGMLSQETVLRRGHALSRSSYQLFGRTGPRSEPTLFEVFDHEQLRSEIKDTVFRVWQNEHTYESLWQQEDNIDIYLPFIGKVGELPPHRILEDDADDPSVMIYELLRRQVVPTQIIGAPTDFVFPTSRMAASTKSNEVL